MQHTISMYANKDQMIEAMQKEIDNLESELADAKQANSYNRDVLDDMYNDISELRKDKARLDWLADKNNEIGNVILPAHCVRNNLTSMRDAIDAAMKEVK